jgi:multiple sugar transport system substrate-binding protein
MPIEQWYVNVLSDVSPKATLDFTTFKSPTGQTISYATGSAWAIPTGSKNKAAACRFAKVMTETSTWITAAQTRIDKYKTSGSLFTGLLTANKEADDKVKAMITTPSNTFKDAIDATYAASDASFTVPGNPAAAEFTTAWTDAVNRVLTGQATAQASLDQAQKEAQSALDTAWASFGK